MNRLTAWTSLLVVVLLTGCASNGGGNGSGASDPKAACEAAGGKWRAPIRQCDRWGD